MWQARYIVVVSYARVIKGGAVGVEHLKISKWANAKSVLKRLSTI